MKKNITSLAISLFASISVIYIFQSTFYNILVLSRFDDLDGLIYSLPAVGLSVLLFVIIAQKRENIFTTVGFWMSLSSAALLMASIIYALVVYKELGWIVLVISLPVCFFLLLAAIVPFFVSLFVKSNSQETRGFSGSLS